MSASPSYVKSAEDVAKEQTAYKLGISVEKVTYCIEVYQAFSRFVKKNKQARISERERRMYVMAQQEFRSSHPERCFCDADGIEVERKWDEDGIVRTEMVENHGPIVSHPPLVEKKWFRCSRCGKEYSYPELVYA